jgi:hypothetical protein
LRLRTTSAEKSLVPCGTVAFMLPFGIAASYLLQAASSLLVLVELFVLIMKIDPNVWKRILLSFCRFSKIWPSGV